MKVLVTGATGFLGNSLCARLVDLGHTVYGLGRNSSKGKILSKQGTIFLQGCLSDLNYLSKAMLGVDVVFHCAAFSSPWGPWKYFYKSNVIGTSNVIKATVHSKVQRLIYVSSPSIYFKFSDQYNLIEDETPSSKSINNYIKSKKIAEKIILDATNKGVPIIILRPRGIFGEGDSTLFPRLLRTMNEKGIPLIRGGKIKIDLTYIDNAVKALVLAMEAPRSCEGEAYNITNGEPMILKDIYNYLFDILNIQPRYIHLPYNLALCYSKITTYYHQHILRYKKEPILTPYTLGTLSFSKTFDISKAINELKYDPTAISMKEGLQSFATWWQNDKR